MIAARLFSVLSVVAVGAAAAILPRDDLSGLYAYGTGISGLGLYSDADGMFFLLLRRAYCSCNQETTN